MAQGSRAVFLDRDGVLNEVVYREGRITSPRAWDEVRDCIDFGAARRLKSMGFRLVLVTNQPEIERGLVAREFVEAVNARYQELCGLDAVYMCPWSDDGHPWRKPNPGMFLAAAEALTLDLSASYHVGDTAKDVGAARRAGVTAVILDRPYNQDVDCDLRLVHLGDLVARLEAKG